MSQKRTNVCMFQTKEIKKTFVKNQKLFAVCINVNCIFIAKDSFEKCLRKKLVAC